MFRGKLTSPLDPFVYSLDHSLMAFEADNGPQVLFRIFVYSLDHSLRALV